MFCHKCGNQILEGFEFCNKCGEKLINENMSNEVSSSSQKQSVMIRDFQCSSCGASLKIPKNPRSVVSCSYCKNECIIESVVKNAEIAAKEHINSGIHLFASQEALHNALLDALTYAPFLPLDALDVIEIIREERYCTPAYCFYCNGSASFTYEKAVDSKLKYSVPVTKNFSTVKEETHTEWHPGNSTASVSMNIFVPGNKEMAEPMMKLYSSLDPRNLIDVEQMQFPSDVKTYDFDLPQTVVFAEYVLPVIDNLLKEQAINIIANQQTRNLSIGGSNVQKDIVRVYFGIYRLIYRYRDIEYSIWISGDGKKWCLEELPEDVNRKAFHTAKQQELDAINRKGTGGLIFGIIICAILALFTYGISLIGLALFIPLLVKRNKENTVIDAQRTAVEGEINYFNAQTPTMIQEFKKKKSTLSGIYNRR